MENNHTLCLFVNYYLSRFNLEAYQNLGYSTMNDAHNSIGKILNVNPHTVKNMRDQFDPLHGFRVGWYQEPLSPSRARIVQALENLEEIEIRSIVEDILSGKILKKPNEIEHLKSITSEEIKDDKLKKFILRGPTGKAAEEYFIKHYSENKNPIQGNLVDCRDLGVGYDFRIEKDSGDYFIEVKGLSDFSGGVLFTSKEWIIAEEKGDKFFLCIISNLSEEPNIIFIQNPAKKLNPKKNIYTTISINWSVTEKQLAELND